MGKYVFSRRKCRFKSIPHPLSISLPRKLRVPHDYTLYGNGAEREKWSRTISWVSQIVLGPPVRPCCNLVIDAFAGVGVLATFYRASEFKVYACEKNPSLAAALGWNMRWNERLLDTVVYCGDNEPYLGLLPSNLPDIRLIDLDAYGSCVPQIREAVRILKDGSLFITSGDIYAGYRFRNWKFSERRYGILFTLRL